MRKLIIIILLLIIITPTVSAAELTAPTAPSEAQEFLPENSISFTDDLWYVLKQAFSALFPSLSEAAGASVSAISICMLLAMVKDINGFSARTVELVGTISVATALLVPSNSLISIGIKTAESISHYAKLFVPVITAALAAEGGTVTSATLYTGTILFNTVIMHLVTSLLIPILYVYIALSIAKSSVDAAQLNSIHKFVKWLMTWILKIAIYIFTGYLGVSGVISGHADTSAIKAAKIAITGTVPVIGNIISDASETILVSAGLAKNAIGTYGLLAMLAIWIGPFVKIGTHYLVLKITGAVCGVFGSKQTVSLIDDFSSVMGYLVAITGTLCLLFFISTVCFLRGVG